MIKPIFLGLIGMVAVVAIALVVTSGGPGATGQVIAGPVAAKDCGTITITDPSQAYSIDQSKLRCFAEQFANCNPVKLGISLSFSVPGSYSVNYDSLQELSVQGWENSKCKYVQKVTGGGRTMVSNCLLPESVLKGTVDYARITSTELQQWCTVVQS